MRIGKVRNNNNLQTVHCLLIFVVFIHTLQLSADLPEGSGVLVALDEGVLVAAGVGVAVATSIDWVAKYTPVTFNPTPWLPVVVRGFG